LCQFSRALAECGLASFEEAVHRPSRSSAHPNIVKVERQDLALAQLALET
jgi:hypothetical protein